MDMNNKRTATLKNWLVFDEYIYSRLYGNVYGHDKFEDGTQVGTSNIINVIREENYFLIETKNTLYKCMLEDACKDYNVKSLLELY